MIIILLIIATTWRCHRKMASIFKHLDNISKLQTVTSLASTTVRRWTAAPRVRTVRGKNARRFCWYDLWYLNHSIGDYQVKRTWKWRWWFLFCRLVQWTCILTQTPTKHHRKSGKTSLLASPQRSERWWSSPNTSQGLARCPRTTRSLCWRPEHLRWVIGALVQTVPITPWWFY